LNSNGITLKPNIRCHVKDQPALWLPIKRKLVMMQRRGSIPKNGRHSRAGGNHEVLSEANLKAYGITISNQHDTIGLGMTQRGGSWGHELRIKGICESYTVYYGRLLKKVFDYAQTDKRSGDHQRENR
jgi:hypothetical protein